MSTTTTTSGYAVLPWKTRIAVSFLSLLTDTARRPDGSINRTLLKLLDIKSSANPNPINGVKSHDVTVNSSRNLWFRLFIPTTTTQQQTTLPVIVFFHGGGFTFLSAASKPYDIVCRRFARRLNAVVVSVNYRLAPEFRFPCQYDDGLDVLAYLESNPRVLPDNADLSKCFLAGDSAGANICHHVAVRAIRAGFKQVKVIGLISIQPFFGGEEKTESELRLTNTPIVSLERTEWIWKNYLPVGSNKDHEAANVCGPNAVDLSSLDYPDTIVFVGGLDPLQDWQRRYYEWLKGSGKEAVKVEYPNSIHAFYAFPELPESSQLITEVKDFITKRLAKLQPQNGH